MSYSKWNVVYRLQKWMDSVPGQTFLNYAYSWGASIVILGAMFKLTHLPGANFMLFLGMGTEVFVFFLSAFDRPFDKTQDGMDIPMHVTEEYLEGEGEQAQPQPSLTPNPSTESLTPNPSTNGEGSEYSQASGAYSAYSAQKPQEPVAPSEPATAPSEPAAATAQPAAATAQPSEPAVASAQPAAPAFAAVAQNSPELEEAQNNYIEELKKLVETLGKVNEQSTRLTRDSEEMDNLNRTLTGISKVYEMQLKGASKQIGTIDEINEQSRKLAQQIEQLNKIYARMIEAMTVNMRAQAPTQNLQTQD
ncbi:MAG: gliding motility protein GldL [Prevotellaceae bacterium]|nr:gliding motility protein GldL [Prevotellaceae bacterium]